MSCQTSCRGLPSQSSPSTLTCSPVQGPHTTALLTPLPDVTQTDVNPGFVQGQAAKRHGRGPDRMQPAGGAKCAAMIGGLRARTPMQCVPRHRSCQACTVTTPTQASSHARFYRSHLLDEGGRVARQASSRRRSSLGRWMAPAGLSARAWKLLRMACGRACARDGVRWGF